ncbi:MAG TPA: type II toxin-antitoxin system RelE/ParE family toxin [Candidatus Norongarragalinales archaeon]|nr:type II toxin-antitoxin system RelE/ParE family toxin [Candidatus Norongarragalinales archaeon]
MAWKIFFSPGAYRDLNGLEKKDAGRIMKKLEEAAQDPQHYFKKLVGEEDYRLRVGDYRVIALFLNPQKLIVVEKIGHRKNVYER